MKRARDAVSETRLLTAYVGALPAGRARAVLSHLHCTCREFRKLYPQQSLLGQAHTTEWVPPWRDVQLGRCSPKSLALRLQATRRWLSWAFERGELDDNALAYASPTGLIEGTEPPLVLRHNLQRGIAIYLAERAPRLEHTRLQYRVHLDAFNVFINRRRETAAQHQVCEEALVDFLRNLAGKYTESTTMRAAGIVNGLLDFLFETGRIAQQPLAEVLARHRGRTRRQAIQSILAAAPGAPLAPVVPSPLFVSALAPHLEAYLKLMRAVGRRYERVETILQYLDRFVAAEPAGEVLLTRDLLGRWLASTSRLAPSTLRSHASAARQFCRYMARFEPRTWIPDRSLYAPRLPQFRPHVFNTEELRGLLAGTARLPATRWPLAPLTFRTLLLVLYATGLRVSEALRLRIRDVDLEACTFFIAETKFFKSRWVPFSTSLATELRAYLAARTEAVSTIWPDAPFFINSHRKRYSYSQVHRTFRHLLREAGIVSTTRRGDPRLHDIRHAFAGQCVLRWYREGADVQAKLPLLATYLGHGTVLATHVYLNSTAELLREASGRFESAFGSLVAPQKEIHDDVG